MDAKTKKILASVGLVLAVIVVDKFFRVSDKAVSKLHGGTTVSSIRAVK